MASVLLLLISLCCVTTYANVVKPNGENGEPRRPENSNYLNCFSTYIPNVNRLMVDSRERCGNCVAIADSERYAELNAVNSTRVELYSEVQRVKELLPICFAKEDHFGYFDCLTQVLEKDRQIVDDISRRSSRYSNKIRDIEEKLMNCFSAVIRRTKESTSAAASSLENCLKTIQN